MENTTQIYTAAVLEGGAEVIKKAWADASRELNRSCGG